MQVYFLLMATADSLCLIAKKRITNAYWGRQVSHRATVVNQAGQWCLPGGRAEGGDATYIDAGLREFREETGVDLTRYGVECRQVHYEDFVLIVGEVPSRLEIFQVEAEANANLQPRGTDPARPHSAQVADWELEEVSAVSTSVLHAFLGVRQPTPGYVNVGHWRQAIDWYGWIGQDFRT